MIPIYFQGSLLKKFPHGSQSRSHKSPNGHTDYLGVEVAAVEQGHVTKCFRCIPQLRILVGSVAAGDKRAYKQQPIFWSEIPYSIGYPRTLDFRRIVKVLQAATLLLGQSPDTFSVLHVVLLHMEAVSCSRLYA